MQTWVIIKSPSMLVLTHKEKAHLHLIDHGGGMPEIVHEFQAPTIDVANVVYDVYDGTIDDIDEFICDLCSQYGYLAIPKDSDMLPMEGG